MLRRLAWAAQAIGRALGSVPPASALGGAFAAWSEVARRTGVRVRPTPLILQGRRDGLEAAARVLALDFAALPADPAAVVGILEELTQAGAMLHPSHRPASPYR